jgi:hypothetical protein
VTVALRIGRAAAKVGGRAGLARVESGRAAVRAAWDLEVAGREDHPRPSGSSSMP